MRDRLDYLPLFEGNTLPAPLPRKEPEAVDWTAPYSRSGRGLFEEPLWPHSGKLSGHDRALHIIGGMQAGDVLETGAHLHVAGRRPRPPQP